MSQKNLGVAPGDVSLVLDPSAITETILRSAFRKAHLTLPKVVLMGWLAGMYLAIGAQLFMGVMTDVSSSGPAKVLGGIFFTTGLICILVCGAELFTGNVLIMVAVLARRVYVWEYLWDLTVLFHTNFLGCITFAVVIWGSGVNGIDEESITSTGKVLCSVAVKKASLPLYQCFLRSIMANICVCLAVLLCTASKSPAGKFLGCVMPITCFIVCGYEHSIANQYIYSAATLLGCSGFSQSLAWGRLYLCACGNMLGAAVLALSYWYIYIHDNGMLQLQHVPHFAKARQHFFPESVDPAVGVAVVDNMTPAASQVAAA